MEEEGVLIAVVQLTTVGRTSLNEKLVGLLALKDAMVTVIGRRGGGRG